METVTKMKGYVPQEERKKILLMCDDIRTHSGIGTVAREIVLHTCHKYNYINLGAAIQHPEKGQRIDISKATAEQTGISDSFVHIIPTDGYGNPDIVRSLINQEKPDAIFIITDPRYWEWLFQIENEIRNQIPIVYLNIWDDYPAPMYNKAFYESCDLLMGISKQTVNINKLVLGEKAKNKIIKYVPHGLNDKMIYPITKDSSNYSDFLQFKQDLFGKEDYGFALFFNSRNIRRKQIPDTIWAYKQFIDKLSEEQAKKCVFVLKTERIEGNGTDLPAVIEMLCGDNPKYNFKFVDQKLSTEQMNYLYNCTDAQIQLTSNEGWGLSLTEAMLVGNPIIANVTGGMQDQMRFETEQGMWIDFDDIFPSNHTGKYTKCGPWAFPVFPNNRSIIGSPPTPYIFDDRCRAEDAAEQIYKVWNLSPSERNKIGEIGRKWATGKEAGFTSEHMAYRIIENLNQLFNTWTPRKKYEFIKIDKKESKVAPHTLIY